MSAESFISDEERYADDTFEQESDTEVPEATEIESEISEVSDAEDNDGQGHDSASNSKMVPFRYSAPLQTDAVPFDSSSDEEDDVIVGQTLVEINTPSMHFQEEENLTMTRIRREIRPLKYQKTQPLKSIDEDSDGSVSEEESLVDSEEEREFQKIREMEEHYLLQNSAKTPKQINSSEGSSNRLESVQSDSKTSASESSQEDKDDDSNSLHKEESLGTEKQTPKESEIDPIPELIDKIMEQFTPIPQIPQQIQTDFVEIVGNSLTSLQNQSRDVEEIDTIVTDDLPQPYHRPDDSIRMTFSFEPNHILSPENIAKVFFDAMNATNITYASEQQKSHSKSDESQNLEERKEANAENYSQSRGNSVEERNNKQNDEISNEHGDKEVELEYHEKSSSPEGVDNDNYYEDESYYDTQFEYQITSKTPSCFNSEDYVFHANFIRPSPTTDRFRVKSHPRKSMSFSNERMREIERHNQILLRKILTQKPTYVAKSAQHKSQSSKTNSQTNVRLTTSAVNRKKQQRQIDLDNQVLKRKLEAIALRRRPLIT
ncbi:protein hemingway [Musca domestica]|uniref:Protein hemingway n=1 Tax=Musca domestica TaxID=7370 RepID=A0A9J7CWT5_MUSDO|nr:protein hemingway [Musca domestica]